MTHEEIVAAVREVIGLPTSDLVTAIAGKSTAQGGQIRQGLEDKTKDALLELFDKERVPGNEVEKRFRDVFWAVIDQRCYYAIDTYFNEHSPDVPEEG